MQTPEHAAAARAARVAVVGTGYVGSTTAYAPPRNKPFGVISVIGVCTCNPWVPSFMAIL
jgi:hypothetical protein